MPGRAESKSDSCPIDLNPLECTIRRGCRYWDRELSLCTYRAVKDAEQKQRRVEEFGGSAIQERIRINR